MEIKRVYKIFKLESLNNSLPPNDGKMALTNLHITRPGDMPDAFDTSEAAEAWLTNSEAYRELENNYIILECLGVTKDELLR